MKRAVHFPLLGEPLALDLVNTRVCRDAAVVDLLDTPVALAAWLRAERRRLGWDGPVGAADLAAVRDLRSALEILIHARRDHRRPARAAVQALNQALVAVGPRQLVWAESGPVLSPPSARTRRAALLQAVAADALTLLTGPQAARLRTCAHPGCILQFVARDARRRWCVSAVCGNRARVARHYQRHCQAG